RARDEGTLPSMTYFFLRDATSNQSAAENEWETYYQRFPDELDRVYTHIVRVNACRSRSSAPLRQARLAIAYRSGHRLFWYQMADVGAFYLYPYPDPEDGTDLVIVLVGPVQNPPSHRPE